MADKISPSQNHSPSEIESVIDETEDKLKKAKKEMGTIGFFVSEFKKLKEDFKIKDSKERLDKIWERIGGILSVGILGFFMDKKESEKYKKDRKDIRVTESQSQKVSDVATPSKEKEEVPHPTHKESEVKKISEEKLDHEHHLDKDNEKHEGFKTFEETELKKGAEMTVSNLEGNGRRPVITYVPPGVDLNKGNVRIIYQFHGTYSERIKDYVPKENRNKDNKKDWVGWNRLKQTTDSIDSLARNGENVVLVYPLSGGPRHKNDDVNVGRKKYDRLWMAPGKLDKNGDASTDDFDQLHSEILNRLAINSDLVGDVEVQGHSAGGLALTNIAESGTKIVTAYRYLDANFSMWAERCREASRKNGSPDIYLLIADTKSKSFPKAYIRRSDWYPLLSQQGENGPNSTGIDNVYLLEAKTQHGDMVGEFTGWKPRKA